MIDSSTDIHVEIDVHDVDDVDDEEGEKKKEEWKKN